MALRISQLDYLEFEKPIAELQEKIDELTRVSAHGELQLTEEIKTLSLRNQQLTKKIFSRLSPWQVTQIARHPLRPYMLDYVERIVTDFQQLHGDRMYSDDCAIVTGVGWIGEQRVALIGHQKGRDTQERTKRNFGMPRPEGYRKAQRIMKLAERFKLPLITFIDTPGAYPGVDAEERGQSQAIAQSLEIMTTLKTPIISVVIGEGGSGGALAIGVCDYLIMLEYSTYAVISPEGCASILWKDAKKAPEAAQAMGVTTKDLSKLGLIDAVIAEPLGGAHRHYDEIAQALKIVLTNKLALLVGDDTNSLLNDRYQRLMSFGQFSEA